MEIIRDGKRITLTDNELYQAWGEANLKSDLQNAEIEAEVMGALDMLNNLESKLKDKILRTTAINARERLEAIIDNYYIEVMSEELQDTLKKYDLNIDEE